jgi:hypothetical protein
MGLLRSKIKLLEGSNIMKSIKQQALGVAAAGILEFTPTFHGKWYKGYELLLQCIAQNKEPDHCSFREGVDVWSWEEAIKVIESDAEEIWKPFTEELIQQKVAVAKKAIGDKDVDSVLAAQSIGEIPLNDKADILTNILRKAAKNLNADRERDMYEVSSYSGRCMYGKTCLSITTPAGHDISRVVMEVGKAYECFGQPKKDSMGLGSVYYWPNIPYFSEDD